MVNLGESNAFFAVECRIASPNFCVGVAWARRPSKPRDDTLSALHVMPLFAYLKFGLSQCVFRISTLHPSKYYLVLLADLGDLREPIDHRGRCSM